MSFPTDKEPTDKSMGWGRRWPPTDNGVFEIKRSYMSRKLRKAGSSKRSFISKNFIIRGLAGTQMRAYRSFFESIFRKVFIFD